MWQCEYSDSGWNCSRDSLAAEKPVLQIRRQLPSNQCKSVRGVLLLFQLYFKVLKKSWFCCYLNRGSEHLSCQSESGALPIQWFLLSVLSNDLLSLAPVNISSSLPPDQLCQGAWVFREMSFLVISSFRFHGASSSPVVSLTHLTKLHCTCQDVKVEMVPQDITFFTLLSVYPVRGK